MALGVVVEVDVSVEFLAGEVFVGASADVVGIVEEIGDGSDLADESEEIAALHQAVEALIRRAEFRKIGENGFATGLAAFVGGLAGVEVREGGDEFAAGGSVKKRLDDDVAEGGRGGELALEGGRLGGKSGIEHCF